MLPDCVGLIVLYCEPLVIKRKETKIQLTELKIVVEKRTHSLQGSLSDLRVDERNIQLRTDKE